jgi:vancomycin resistance protein YoaR
MGITGVVASYTTTYGGTPGRLHNVQLVSELIDSTLVAPGATFSFNDTTGERSADRGFQEAPVIINGELENGLGGGVCQVSTTVFNAVYDAGLRIDRRTNHQLYISHYPLGRDATVNYPDIDLVFTNDTEAWLLLRTFVGSGSLTVNLYGTPVERRVETTVAPLTKTGPVPVDKVLDPTLAQGKRKIEEIGVPPRETSVRREVYDAQGLLLYDDTWHSTYDAEPTIVRVGTKKKSKAGNGGNPKSSSADADLAEPISPGLAATTAPATQQ